MWSCLPVDFTSGHTPPSIFLVSRAGIGAGDKITWQKEIHTRASVLTQAHKLCRCFRRSVHFIGPEGRIHCVPCPWSPALLPEKKPEFERWWWYRRPLKWRKRPRLQSSGYQLVESQDSHLFFLLVESQFKFIPHKVAHFLWCIVNKLLYWIPCPAK